MHLNRLVNPGILLGLLLLIFSCNSNKHNKKPAETAYKNLPVGKVYKQITVASDTSISYALYLPTSYNPKKANRVMFIFDAHAGGALPVEKYKSLAEKYNVVLAASNNSKNGQSAGERNRIITGFMSDVEKQFHVDMKKIYTAGFSGGARVATLVAFYNGNVAGVIGCAAGFPQVQNPVNTSFQWVGVVGDKDFNFLELVNLNRQLKANRFKSRLLVFNGKHEWPPVSVMDDAFKIVLKDATIQSAFEVKDDPKSRALEKTEIKQQQMLVRAMEEKSWSWWQKEISKLKDEANKNLSPQENLMNQRLVNYLSMISFIYTDRALKSNQTDAAEKFLRVYETVDPDNPDVFFFKAVRFAMLNQDQQALTSLKTAMDKGFKEMSRIDENSAFDHLRNTPAFKKVVGR